MFSNGERISDVPRVSIDHFRDTVIDRLRQGARIAVLFGQPQGAQGTRLFGVLADENAGVLSILSTDVGESYPSLTPECPQAHWFEREIAEQCRIVPDGHPWLKPIRFESSQPAGVTDFFQVKG